MASAAVLSIGNLDEGPPRPRFPPARAACAVALSVALEAGSLGLTCDIAWRTYVGAVPWTLSRALFYVAVTLVACAAGVDLAFERRSAPRGFAIAAAGALTIAVAGLADNFWRAAYGADASLWSPFFLMGLTGAAIAIAGSALVLAGLGRTAAFRWLLYLALAAGFGLTIAAGVPGARDVPVAGAGYLAVLTLPLICAFGLTLLTVAAQTYARSVRASLAVVALYVVRRTLFAIVVPVAVHYGVATSGLAYRIAGFEPHFSLAALQPVVLLFLPAALIGYGVERNWNRDALGAAGGVAFALVTALWVALAQTLSEAPLPTDRFLTALALTLVAAAVAGMGGARLGSAFGTVLHAEARR